MAEPSRPPPDLPYHLRQFLLTYPRFVSGTLRGDPRKCLSCGDIIYPGETYFWTMYHNTPLMPLCFSCGTALGLDSGQIDPLDPKPIPPFAATDVPW